MKEFLSNKAIPVETGVQAELLVCVLGNFGCAPHTNKFQKHIDEIQAGRWNFMKVNPRGFISLMDERDGDGEENIVLELEEFLWSGDIAPDWAIGVFRMSHGEFMWGDGKSKTQSISSGRINEKHEHNFYDVLEDSITHANAISLRPEPFESGQKIFIAQLNTLTAIESERYYLVRSWCNSGNQRDFFRLGIVFDNKFDAENKCRELLGLELLKTERETFVEKLVNELKKNGEIYQGVGSRTLNLICETIYDLGYKQEVE